MNQPLAALASPEPSHTMAHSWHTQSELDTFSAHPRLARIADAAIRKNPRQLMSQLGSIAQNVAELRSLYGTGHGKEGKARGLQPRHARLVVGSAATLANVPARDPREPARRIFTGRRAMSERLIIFTVPPPPTLRDKARSRAMSGVSNRTDWATVHE